ncbi:MAG: ADP-ribosylglycohydrolase family protein [Planctomycetaceae bacterium]|nr:ADP-ribosylglycohydrolase family protein [Planctomycetaceae bacterium]
MDKRKTRLLFRLWLIAIVVVAGTAAFSLGSTQTKEVENSDWQVIASDVFVDKMKAGWVGQMVGVSVGAPTEAKALGIMFPLERIPKWTADTINESFGEDDLYVEMTFLRTLEVYGLDVSQRQAGIDFANSRYTLWGANNIGRSNMRNGIAPPDSSHPKFNPYADFIDYQIEADFSGIIAPGLPQFAVEMGEKFGRLINYGDGMYGGQFVGAMYSEAYFETDIKKIITEAVKSIPSKSRYAECVNDVLRWYKDNPDDWKKTWQLVNDKYHTGAGFKKSDLNITAVLNGAFVCIGLLYGQSDPYQTMSIAIQCGQDSDCNPSSACGVLFVTIGYNKLPEEFKRGIDKNIKFSYTNYSFPKLIDVSNKLAGEVCLRAGGKIEKTADSKEIFLIPHKPVNPSKFMRSSNPEPVENSRFTAEEMKRITEIEPQLGPKIGTIADVEKFAPGWKVENCREDSSGFFSFYDQNKNVLVTTPPDMGACSLSRDIAITSGKKTKIHIAVCCSFQGDFLLVVKADGRELFSQVVGRDTAKNCLFENDIDLSEFSGKTVKLELFNQANGLGYESACWLMDKIKIISE